MPCPTPSESPPAPVPNLQYFYNTTTKVYRPLPPPSAPVGLLDSLRPPSFSNLSTTIPFAPSYLGSPPFPQLAPPPLPPPSFPSPPIRPLPPPEQATPASHHPLTSSRRPSPRPSSPLTPPHNYLPTAGTLTHRTPPASPLIYAQTTLLSSPGWMALRLCKPSLSSPSALSQAAHNLPAWFHPL